jgi:hypothetical protein
MSGLNNAINLNGLHVRMHVAQPDPNEQVFTPAGPERVLTRDPRAPLTRPPGPELSDEHSASAPQQLDILHARWAQQRAFPRPPLSPAQRALRRTLARFGINR